MSTMVERVAAAIWALNRDTDCTDYALLTPYSKSRADEQARAAIAEMREPTAAMITVIAEETFCPEEMAKRAIRCMIDEALKP